MTTWNRAVAIKNDANAGGSSYDDLTSGAIPAATGSGSLAVPVDRATWALGSENLDRNAEIRGVRGNPSPVEFRGNPNIEIEAIAYPNLVKKLVAKALGSTDSRSGTPPAAITHAFTALESGDLPAVHAELRYDDQFVKVAGLTVAELTLDFPLLEWGKVTANLRGKYMVPNSGDTPSTPSYADYPRRGLLLRDATVTLDGDAIAKLGGFRLVYSNNLADPPDYEPGLNREILLDALGSGIRRILWWPDEQRFLATSITGQLIFQAPSEEESFKAQIAHGEEMVVELDFEPIATTPSNTEKMRITMSNKVYTGGGPDQMSRLDKIQSTFDFGAYLPDSGSDDDLLIEFVDASNTDIS